MAKIPFTLEEWLKDKSQKIETRKGRPAHYIGLDRAGWQVFEIFRANGTSEYRTYHDSYMYCGPEESTYDLFIVTPEEEITEWQRFVSACLQKHGLLDCSAADRIAKNCSTELLDLARKELGNDTPSIIHAQSFNAGLKHGKQEALKDLQENLANNDIYRVPEWLREVLLMVKENGKKEALMGLPRWEKREYAPQNANIYLPTNELVYHGMAISIDELTKLPGFKEDESNE